ncbi:MAG: hypothetical protein ACPL5F_03630, partial [Moorellaceae bacterium]
SGFSLVLSSRFLVLSFSSFLDLWKNTSYRRGHPEHFFEGRYAFQDLFETVYEHRAHTFTQCKIVYFSFATTRNDQILDLSVDYEDLTDCDPSSVTHPVACGAAWSNGVFHRFNRN